MLKNIIIWDLSHKIFLFFPKKIEIVYENSTSFDEFKIVDLPMHIQEKLKSLTIYILLSNGQESFFFVKNDVNFSNEITNENNNNCFKNSKNNI